jgi:hypothetical protein
VPDVPDFLAARLAQAAVEVEDRPIAWKQPALAAGALVLVAAVVGAWAGVSVGDPQTPVEAEPALTVPLPTAAEARSGSADASTAALGGEAVEPVRAAAPRDASVAAAPAPRVRPVELTPAEEQELAGTAPETPVEVPVEQAAAESPSAPMVAAKLPLPDRVVARTIHRIGYSCGQVASTTAVDGGAPGVFKVTCTSGHSYQATPVRGRYHFRRMGSR